MRYPETRTEDVWDELAGVRTPDPYHWLEEGTSEEVRLWQKQQNELASSYVRAWPGFERMRNLVEEHSTARFGSVPRQAGGLWFRSAVQTGAPQASVVVSDTPFGEGRVLFEPALELGPSPFLSWLAPSPDGTLLALGLCTDGSEQNTIRLLDVATGDARPAPTARLMDGWSGGVSWLPDSRGFYVTAIDGAAIDLAQRVLHFDVATGTTTEIPVPLLDERDYRMIQPSLDGTRLLAYQSLTSPRPVAVAELTDPAAPRWRPFVTCDAIVHGYLMGDTYVAITDLDAPRGRLVAIPIDQPDPTSWVTLYPESEAVLRTLTPVGDELYLTEFVDTYTRVRVVDLHGVVQQEVELPSKGTLAEAPFPYMNLVPRGDRDSFMFAFSSLTASWGVYQHRPGSDEVVELDAPAVRIDAVVEDHCATSADGTAVPYHVVRPRSVTSGPTLIYAYGGFNAPFLPQFPGPMAAFVAAGGIFVHAHLRGGAELGRDWWEGGRLKNKQNGYADLYAVAEELISHGITTPDTLAVTGGSNGGLMAGVAVTQRPDLWRAAVPRVPLLDIIGACRENYGRYAVGLDYADLDDPEDVRRLLTFSPYHLVSEQAYPAVFLDAGDTDPRCSPWHARKFGARMQAAQRGVAPVLVRVWENAGHGWATDKAVAVEQNAEWLAFVCRELGLQV
jgi:prolyl oligopeptidase